MQKTVVAIFDVGKSNKKLFLFDENYQIVYESTTTFEEILDEDGFATEDVEKLAVWLVFELEKVKAFTDFNIKAVNFSAYGASFVYLDQNKELIGPLYNYLKPADTKFLNDWYKTYGGVQKLSLETASPALGNLNSGLQILQWKHLKTSFFEKVVYALHLPQFLSHVFSGEVYTDITSIGCHTMLWNFAQNDYHQWLEDENLLKILPAIKSQNEIFEKNGLKIGIGLHDSSSALIPYLKFSEQPFVLISTGTWCISMNPFNDSVLTAKELDNDCLNFLQYTGQKVKASRAFLGQIHEDQTKRIAKHFFIKDDFYKTIAFDNSLIDSDFKATKKSILTDCDFANLDLNQFKSEKQAYHQLMHEIVQLQIASTACVISKQNAPKNIYVDGGFSKNPIFMQLLAKHYQEIKVFAAEVSQASALGAALAIHEHWNEQEYPQKSQIIKLKAF